MIPSWLAISTVALLVAIAINRFFPTEYRWFNRLRRPDWLTFERAIPLIWTFIFICLVWSAVVVWNTLGGTWQLMAIYLLLEIAIMSYTPVMTQLRSLRVGVIIGGTGFFIGLFLAVLVFPVSSVAGWLLVPYLLWSPIGTYVTWEMMQLNP
jgi:tryptophan-rich sensory protein